MILADTSAWIEYIRGDGGPVRLRIRELVSAGGPLATTEPVVAEVLIGARDRTTEQRLRGLLGQFDHLPFDATADFGAAVDIYRRCRDRGVTPRGLMDCMICSVALRYDAAVLAADTDFARFAEVVALKLDPASSL